MNGTHSQRATVSLQKLAEFDPAFASLSLWANHRDTDGQEVLAASIDAGGNITVDRKKVEFAPAYTDGRTVFYGTKFATWSLLEQMAVEAHELMHIAFRHVNRAKALRQRFGSAYDQEVFNIAADAIINETLRLAGYKLPGNCIYLVELFKEVFNETITAADAVGEWDMESLYVKIMSEKAKSGGQGQGQQHGQGAGAGGSRAQNGSETGDGASQGDAAARTKAYAEGKDFHHDLDQDGPLTPQDAQEDAEWQQRLERAMRYGAQAGKGIGKLGHKIADLPKSRVPWELVLRRAVNKAVTRSPRPSLLKPARRWIGAEDDARRRGLPTPAYEGGFIKANTRPRIVVGVDVSGSIGDAILEIFCGEIATIGNKTGSEIHVLVFDTKVLNRVKMDGIHFEAEIKKIDFARGGGTSFVEVMDIAEEIDPSIIVMLTDIEGPFRTKAPRVPVIWAHPGDKAPDVPYGHKLSLAA